jgi:hypothetical protein
MDQPEAKGFNYLYGLINLAVVFVIVWILWYLFMHPNGVWRLYTPMYGFALVVAMLAAVVFMADVLGAWPFRPAAEAPNRVGRGAGMTVTAIILMLVLVYGVFWNFIGALGVAYFSPESIVAAGGTGAEPWNARENASTAIVYFFTAFLWWGLFWAAGFGRYPWQGDSRATLAWSRFCAVGLLAVVAFAVLFHPHVCYLFYPPQTMAGVKAWWSDFAGTDSAYFSLGLVLCILFWIIASAQLWEGWPWRGLHKEGRGTLASGVVAWLVTAALGCLTLYALYLVFNTIWMEPFVGGQYTDAPYWRYIHAGEIAGFWLLAAFILKVFFNNFPNRPPLAARAVIRTLIAMAGGMLIYWFYFSAAGSTLLGRVPGFAQPDDTPLVWTILFLVVVLVQKEFFLYWPLGRREETLP